MIKIGVIMGSRPINTLIDNLPDNCSDRLNPGLSITRFCIERDSIRLRKEIGYPRPWTTDDILHKYSFTNVCREYDKVSKFIFNWVIPVLENDEDLFFNLLIARHINRPATLNTLGLSVTNQCSDEKIKIIRTLNPMFANPYQCPAQYKTINNFDTREQWIFKYFPGVVKDTMKILSNKKSIEEIADEMKIFWGWDNNFSSTQALLDLGHLRPDLVDKNSMVKVGPGAAPALKLLDMSLIELRDYDTVRHITGSLANIEHLLCEWRKYLELKYDIRKKTKRLEYK